MKYLAYRRLHLIGQGEWKDYAPPGRDTIRATFPLSDFVMAGSTVFANVYVNDVLSFRVRIDDDTTDHLTGLVVLVQGDTFDVDCSYGPRGGRKKR